MSVTILNKDRIEIATLENAYGSSYNKRINEAWTANFRLPAEDKKNDYCDPDNLVRLDDDGKIGLFRIQEPSLNTGSRVQTYQLIHVIDTLNDQMFAGQDTINEGLSELAKGVESGAIDIPVKSVEEFSPGDEVIISGRDKSETITIDSIFGAGNNGKVKMEVRGSIGPISESNKDENVLKDQILHINSGLENSYPAGTVLAIPISAENAISRILNEQEIKNWKLGQCDFDIDDLIFQFHDTTLLKALLQVSDKLTEKAVWKWNTDSYPWTLNLIKPTETKPDGYIDKGVNLQSINLKRDTSKLVTRLYPYGKDNISIKPITGQEYIDDSEAIDKWGIKERVIRTNHTTPSNLLTAAENILEEKSKPKLSFSTTAADISDLTGEDIHKYEIGDWVQITDPENDLQYKEILVEKSKSNIGSGGGQINLQFANKTEFFEKPESQFSSIISNLEQDLTDTINVFDEIIENLNNDVEDLKENIEQARGLIDSERARLVTLKNYLEDVKDQLKQDVSNLHNRIDTSRSLIDSVESDLTQAEQDLNNRIDNAQDTISQAQNNIDSLNSDLDTLEQSLKGDINSVQSNLNDRIDQAQNEINQAQENINNLQSSLQNLGDELNQIGDNVSEIDVTANSIKAIVSDNSNNVSQIEQTATSIQTGVQNNSGDLSTIKQTAEEIQLAVQSNNDDISAIQVTADSIQLTVEDNAGNISTIKQTATSIESIVQNNSGDLSSILQKADEISLAVSDANDNIVEISVTATEIQSTVTDNSGNISNITQTANTIQSTVSNNSGDLSTIKQTAEAIQLAVEDNSGNISSIEETATSIQSTVEASSGEISTIKQTATSIETVVDDNSGNLSTILQTAEEINLAVSGIENDVAGIKVTADAIKATVTDNSGNISNITQTVNSITSAVQNNSGDISAIIQKANSIQSIVENNSGDISSIKQTAEGIQTIVENSSGDISGIEQTATSIQTTVSNTEGDLSGLIQTAESIETVVANNSGDISLINQTADEIVTAVENNSGDISSIEQMATSIQTTVENSEGDLSTIIQKANTIQTAVADNEGNISTIKQSANSILTVVANNSGDISGIEQTANSIKTTVGDHSGLLSQIDQKAGQIETIVTDNQDQLSRMIQDPTEFDFEIWSKDEVVSFLSISQSGFAIHGDNIDISGKDIDVSGDQITLNGHTTVEDDFNVGGNVWLDGDGQSAKVGDMDWKDWHIMVPNHSMQDAKFAVSEDGDVIAENLYANPDEPIVSNGEYIQGIKVVDVGQCGTQYFSRRGLDDPTGYIYDLEWINKDFNVPSGKRWVVLVDLSPEETINGLVNASNMQFSDTEGFSFAINGTFVDSGNSLGGSLTAGNYSGINLRIYHFMMIQAGQSKNDLWASQRVFYQVLEIPDSAF